MIEVLVTALILAIGVLGAAGMQLNSFKNLRSSHSLTTAAMLGTDFGERMRANPTALDNNLYNHTSAPESYVNCEDTLCSVTQLAGYDIVTWTEVLQDSLPSASSSVSRIVGSDSFIVTVYWDDDLSGSRDKTCPAESADDLDCYTLTVSL